MYKVSWGFGFMACLGLLRLASFLSILNQIAGTVGGSPGGSTRGSPGKVTGGVAWGGRLGGSPGGVAKGGSPRGRVARGVTGGVDQGNSKFNFTIVRRSTVINVNFLPSIAITMAMATGWLGGIGSYRPHPSRLCNTPPVPCFCLRTLGGITNLS